MHRYHFQLTHTFIDALSAEEAVKAALKSGLLVIQEGEIPVKVKLYCTVTKTPNPSGMYSASAKRQHKDGALELVASADAPSAERAMYALGVNNPTAHTTHIYKQRFNDNYELVTGEPPTRAASQ